MRDRLAIYSKILKDNLAEQGCIFIMQKSELISRSLVLQFHHKQVPEQLIHKIVSGFKCTHMIQYGNDVVTILLQEEI